MPKPLAKVMSIIPESNSDDSQKGRRKSSKKLGFETPVYMKQPKTRTDKIKNQQ